MHTRFLQKVKGLVLNLIEDMTVLKLYIRLAAPAITDTSFNSNVQVRTWSSLATWEFTLSVSRLDGWGRALDRWLILHIHARKQSNRRRF